MYIIGKYIATDKTTGLMFDRTLCSKMTWENALKYCKKSKTGGFSDWRLANIKELGSIVSYTKTDPAINKIAFPDTQSEMYWSSTTDPRNKKHAYVINFHIGSKESVPKTELCWVRAVRGKE